MIANKTVATVQMMPPGGGSVRYIGLTFTDGEVTQRVKFPSFQAMQTWLDNQRMAGIPEERNRQRLNDAMGI
jgi:hypothetical protein